MKVFRSIAELSRIRLSLAVAFSAVTGYFLSGSTGILRLAETTAGVFFLSAGSSAINQFMERHADKKMSRTMKRPLPEGKISICLTLSVSSALLITGIVFLALAGIMPLLLGVTAIVIYTQVYTRLKLYTILAVIPGALVGAIPPLIGYTAGGKVQCSTEIIILTAFMFLWQFPHFWLITLKYAEDYRRAGFKTITDIIPEKQLKRLIFAWVSFIVTCLSFYTACSLIIPVEIVVFPLALNILFLAAFYSELFLNRPIRSANIPFLIMNIYSFYVFILFIIRSLFPGSLTPMNL